MKITKKQVVIAGFLLIATAGAYGAVNLWFLSPEQKEARYLKRGIASFEEEDYGKARVAYKNALRINPTDPVAAFRLGLVDEAENDFPNAFSNFHRALQQDQYYVPALEKVVSYILLGNNTQRAKALVEELARAKPDLPETHAMMASVLLRQQDIQGAEKEARKSIEIDPSNVTAATVLGTVLLSADKAAEAEKILADSIQRNPKAITLLILRAALSEKSGDLVKTAESYQPLFKLRPKTAMYRKNLAEIYVRANKLDEAESVLRSGVASVSDSTALKYLLVNFLAEQRSLDAAEKEVHTFLSQTPKDKTPAFWMIALLSNHGDTAKARDLLQEVATTGEPNDSHRAQVILAHLDYKQGLSDEAIKRINKVLVEDPSNVEGLFARASINFDHMQLSDAVSDLRALLKGAPKEQRAYSLLAESLLAQGHPDLAIDTLNQLVTIAPANTAARVRLAQMYRMNGNAERADDVLNTVLRKTPSFADAWEAKARFALDQKDMAAATNAIEELDKFPEEKQTALLLKGIVAVQSGAHDKGAALLEDALRVNPSTTTAQQAAASIVELYAKTNDWAKAIASLKSLQSDRPIVQTLLGICYRRNHQEPEAVAAFDKAIAAQPRNSAPFLEKADILQNQKKYDEAVSLLDKAATLFASDPRPALMAADILIQNKAYQRALDFYDRVLAKDPENAAALNNWASLVSDNFVGNTAKMEQARQRAEQLSGSKIPAYIDTLAWVYYRQGQVDRAYTLLSRIVTDKADVPAQIRYHYGIVLLQKGLKAEAKKELERALSGKEPYQGLDEATAALKHL